MYRNIPKEENLKIKGYWEQSEGDRDKFKELVVEDKELKGSWYAYDMWARRHLKNYSGYKSASKFAFMRLKPKDRERITDLLTEQGMEAAQKAFPQFRAEQFRNFAERTGIKVKDLRKEEKEPPTEKDLIDKVEKGEIEANEFLDKLPDNSDLKAYWMVIYNLLVEKRVVRNTDFLPLVKKLEIDSKKRVHKLNSIRGILAKFVEWGALVSLRVGGHVSYYCSLPDFYESKELHQLMSAEEVNRVASTVGEVPRTADEISNLLYGNTRSANFVATVLTRFVDNGLIKYARGVYDVTSRGKELGLDTQSSLTLEATALENELFIKAEKTENLPKNLDEVAGHLKKDIAGKTLSVTDLSGELENKELKLLFIGEVLYGSQYTDQKLLSWILDSVNSPTLSLTSGLVQGRFEVKNKAKSRGLAEEGGLHRIESQFRSAGLLLEWLEKITTCRVCVIQSDDDWRLAEDYATLMHLLEGKNPWKFGVSWQSFSSEMQRRLENKELRRKIRIQWEIIQSYMYRIGRSLLNKEEVKAKIGIFKSEYRLIIEIMVAKRHKFDYPKEYEQVVNVDALYGNTGKRIVSPDPLRLKVSENKEIRLIHNAGFSDITQYQDTHQHLSAIARHLGLSRQQVPWILADYHQEAFFVEYLHGTWIMNLPGMQNTRPAAAYMMNEWSTKILEAKERRQSRVRKEPVSSSAVELSICRDGRIRFRILNNSVKARLEALKGEPEQREVAVVATDTQFGSITNQPELVAKFLDYGLYERKATKLYINGDFIHGNIYPQHNAESRPMRLTSMHAQKMFAFNLVVPLILDAPCLVDLAGWLGNHEWHNFDTKRSGDMPLTFLETGLKGVLMERARAGIKSNLERAMMVSRIRWKDTHNPQGDIINWPFFGDTICGFKVMIQHMWQPFAGRTPADEGKKWLKNMAWAARNTDLIVGGDKHSVWMAEIDDKQVVQCGASASQSGYELARGLMATVMFTLIEFSNRDGITIEFVPWEFLNSYKFQGPVYRGKDNEFLRPKRGTRDYRLGRMAPYIENMIDEQTQYMEI